jgi:hypothetical protein
LCLQHNEIDHSDGGGKFAACVAATKNARFSESLGAVVDATMLGTFRPTENPMKFILLCTSSDGRGALKMGQYGAVVQPSVHGNLGLSADVSLDLFYVSSRDVNNKTPRKSNTAQKRYLLFSMRAIHQTRAMEIHRGDGNGPGNATQTDIQTAARPAHLSALDTLSFTVAASSDHLGRIIQVTDSQLRLMSFDGHKLLCNWSVSEDTVGLSSLDDVAILFADVMVTKDARETLIAVATNVSLHVFVLHGTDTSFTSAFSQATKERKVTSLCFCTIKAPSVFGKTTVGRRDPAWHHFLFAAYGNSEFVGVWEVSRLGGGSTAAPRKSDGWDLRESSNISFGKKPGGVCSLLFITAPSTRSESAAAVPVPLKYSISTVSSNGSMRVGQLYVGFEDGQVSVCALQAQATKITSGSKSNPAGGLAWYLDNEHHLQKNLTVGSSHVHLVSLCSNGTTCCMARSSNRSRNVHEDRATAVLMCNVTRSPNSLVVTSLYAPSSDTIQALCPIVDLSFDARKGFDGLACVCGSGDLLFGTVSSPLEPQVHITSSSEFEETPLYIAAHNESQTVVVATKDASGTYLLKLYSALTMSEIWRMKLEGGHVITALCSSPINDLGIAPLPEVSSNMDIFIYF